MRGEGHEDVNVPFALLAIAAIAWALAVRHQGTGLAVGVVVKLVITAAPFVGTVAIGTLRYGNLRQTGPAEDAPGESREIGTAARRPLFVHLSDTHFVGAALSATFQGLSRDSSALKALSNEVLDLNPAYLFVTGDVTDTGSEAEWQQAEEILLAPARAQGIVVIVAPGNHDLQPAFGGVTGAGSPELASAILQRRYLDASGIARAGLKTTAGDCSAVRTPTRAVVRQNRNVPFVNPHD